MKNSTIKNCQYQQKGCQKIAQFQHFIKIGLVKLNKGLICLNCKQFLEQKTNKPLWTKLKNAKSVQG